MKPERDRTCIPKTRAHGVKARMMRVSVPMQLFVYVRNAPRAAPQSQITAFFKSLAGVVTYQPVHPNKCIISLGVSISFTFKHRDQRVQPVACREASDRHACSSYKLDAKREVLR